MANGANTNWLVLYHAPGNPQLPVLPNPGDPIEGLLYPFGTIASTTFLVGPLDPENVLSVIGASPGIARGFAQTWLNGIGGSPNPVDFGNITAPKQATVTVHNTYRNAVTISAVSAIDGMTLLSPVVPVIVPAFGSVVFTFEVAITGPATFDQNVTFTTSEGNFDIRFVGRRVIIFNAIPEAPMTERLTFGTDVMTSENGKEQVMSWRRTPRSIVNLKIREDNDKRRTTLLTKVLGAGYLLHGVQCWWQARQITAAALDTDVTVQASTAAMEIAIGDTMAFITPDLTQFEAEVLSFTGSSITFTQALGTALPLGSYVMPVRFGYMSPNNLINSFAVNLEDFNVQFTLISYDNIGFVDPAYFETHPVDGLPIHKGALYFDGQTRISGIGADDDRFDGQTGDIANRRNQLLGRPEQSVLVLCHTPDQQHAWRRFIHFLRGSWGKFYVPTGTNDLPLFSNLSLGSTSFDIQPMGITSLIGNIAPRRDVKITVDGVSYYRRINSIVDNDTFETITIDSILPGSGTFSPAEVKIEWLTLARIVDDTATFVHLDGIESELRFGIRGVIET